MKTTLLKLIRKLFCKHRWENVIRGELRVTYVEKRCLECGAKKVKGSLG
jgi:hypothetical protein